MTELGAVLAIAGAALAGVSYDQLAAAGPDRCKGPALRAWIGCAMMIVGIALLTS